MNNPEVPDEKIKEEERKGRSETYVLAIEIIFGIIIAVGLLDYKAELVPITFDFETAMILVAFSTVMSSLVGYMYIIKKRYHRNLNRFVVDLILVYFYFQLIYSPLESFAYFVSVYPWIFGGYVVWQVFAEKEWKKQLLLKRFVYSLPIFGAFVGIWVFYTNQANQAIIISKEGEKLLYGQVGYTEWGILLFIFLLVIGYRIASWKIKTE